MNAYRFLQDYPHIAKKSGVYAISNKDSKKGSDLIKVGKANVFANRFTGEEGSSYTTAYPLGFQVNYIYEVPKIGHTNLRGKTKSRVELRESQVHEALDKSSNVQRFVRPKTRFTRPKVTEWFRPDDGPKDILSQGLLPVWKTTGGEIGNIYKCNQFGCKNITRGVDKIDPIREFVGIVPRTSERLKITRES